MLQEKEYETMPLDTLLPGKIDSVRLESDAIASTVDDVVIGDVAMHGEGSDIHVDLPASVKELRVEGSQPQLSIKEEVKEESTVEKQKSLDRLDIQIV